MKFAYSASVLSGSSGPVIHRPLLRVALKGPRGRQSLDMLVDSGSDETQVPSWILEDIGVEITDEEVLLSGFGEGIVCGRVATVDLSFGRGRFELRGRVVSTAEGERQLPLLGHRDFFERYFVSFDAAHRTFSVSEPRR